jgi:hypothetical protein
MLQMEAAIDSWSVISYACVEHQYTGAQLHTEGTRLKAEDHTCWQLELRSYACGVCSGKHGVSEVRISAINSLSLGF